MTKSATVSNAMMALALASAAAFGAYFSVQPAFGCAGTNAGGGNCKQSAPAPAHPGGWRIVESVIRGLRGFVLL